LGDFESKDRAINIANSHGQPFSNWTTVRTGVIEATVSLIEIRVGKPDALYCEALGVVPVIRHRVKISNDAGYGLKVACIELTV
jgi:hypothetical protein